LHGSLGIAGNSTGYFYIFLLRIDMEVEIGQEEITAK
jgi:hypothetical protein